MEVPLLNPFDFSPRFRHITEQIFAHLDNKSLRSCREVSKSWQECIDGKNLSWIQIVNIPTILKDGEIYLHFAARTGQSKMFQKILERSIVKNPENENGETPFHLACKYGHFKIAEMLMERSTELNIELNAKDVDGLSAFHLACESSHSKTVEILMQKSSDLKIDLNAVDNEIDCRTPFQYASENGHTQPCSLS